MILVRFGKLGLLGLADPPTGFSIERGMRLVIGTNRGWELGTVLSADARVANAEVCEIVRAATSADLADADRNEAFALEILSAADAADLPITFIDAEVSLDRAGALLHALPYAPCDASDVLANLSDRFGLPVRLLDLARTPTAKDPPDPEKMTCGKPDGGTGSGCSSCATGGCSTGSCSKGSVKSAAELTAYFTDLREKLHARTPLV